MSLSRRSFSVAALALTALAGPPAHADTRLRVGIIPVLGAAPVFIAAGEGFLRDAGVSADFVTFDSGPNIIQAAATGSIDVYVAGVTPAAIGRTKGIDFRVVLATAIDENVLVMGPALASYFTPGVSPAQAFKTFHEKTGNVVRIAAQPPGSVPSTNLSYWLDRVTHTDPADVRALALGIDATQQALLSNAVEAAVIREPALTIVRKRRPDIRVLAGGEGLFPGQPGTVVAASAALRDHQPKVVQAFVDATLKAIALIRSDPSKVATHVEAALGKGLVDRAVMLDALQSGTTRFIGDPRLIVGPTKAMLDYQVAIGTLKKAPSLDGFFDPQFYVAAQAPATK